MKTKTKRKPPRLLDVLFARSRDDGGSLYAAEDQHLDFEGLIDIGLLYEAQPARTYWCGCGGGGTCDVTWAVHPKDGSKTPFIHCEYCGINRLDPKDLRVWTIQTSELIRMVGESMAFSPPFSEAIPGLVWQLGRKKRRDFYFLRRIDGDERQMIRSFFTTHSTGIVLTSTQTDRRTFVKLDLGNPCFSFTEIADFDENFRIVIDMASIEAETAPIPDVKKRPAPRRGHRAANIERLVHELEQHIRAARDHVWETGSLLPRPSMQEFGRLAGLEKHDVTRCMKDDDAVKLRYLWKVANDIKMVQDWKG